MPKNARVTRFSYPRWKYCSTTHPNWVPFIAALLSDYLPVKVNISELLHLHVRKTGNENQGPSCLRVDSASHWINRFIPCHRKCRKVVVYSSVFHPTFPSIIAIQQYHTQLPIACVEIPASFFSTVVWAMSEPNFSLSFNFEVKNYYL